MRATPTILRLAVCLTSLAPLASAWPNWLPREDALYVRQDDGEDATTTAAETGASATTEEAASTATDDPEETNTDDGDRNTARPTRSGDDAEETGTRTRSDDEEETTKSIPHDAAIAQVSITEPVTSAVPTVLFKIGTTVELGWNYTGLQATPDAIDVLLSCAEVSATWTLTANWTFDAEPTYTWKVEDQDDDETPLLTEMYTLIIKDAEADISDIPEPGKLGSNQNFKFGLYHPQQYVDWEDFECTGCSTAPGGHDVQAVKLAVIMSFITFFTFTYFVAGWGLQ